MEIGKAIAKGKHPDGDTRTGAEKAVEALPWMTRAFTMMDGSKQGSKVSPSVKVNCEGLCLLMHANSEPVDDTKESRQVIRGCDGSPHDTS